MLTGLRSISSVLVKPAGPDCNLACRYCFYSGDAEPDRTLPPVMPDDVLDTLIRKFMGLRMPQSVLCWQGGEPTLAGLDQPTTEVRQFPPGLLRLGHRGEFQGQPG